MLIAHDKQELSQIVEDIKKKALWQGLPTGDKTKILGITFDFGAKNKTDTKYGWMQHHRTVEYQNDLLDIKVPTRIGKVLTTVRCLYEKWFNQEFLINEASDVCTKREIAAYEYLNNQKFPTLESMNKNFPEIEGAVITRKILGAESAIDKLSRLDEKTQEKCLSEISESMKNMHNMKLIWGDAWLGNAMYDNNKLLTYDFGLLPNPSKNKEFLMGKDLVALCMSAASKTIQPTKIIPAIIEAYNPSAEVSNSIIHSLYENAKQNHGPLFKFFEEQLYFSPVYVLSRKEVESVREEIRKNIE